MMNSERFLAFDLGAESCRGVLGILEEGKLKLEEIHRFSNNPSCILGSLYWDIPFLFEEMKKTLKIYKQKYDSELDGISIDSWGVDFALLDEDGKLISNPYHYRDKRTEGMMKSVFKKVSRKQIFELTGIQFLQINTLYQLFAMRNSQLLNITDKILMIADLFNYFFTGRKLQEYTLATTSQMYNPQKKAWSEELLKNLGLPCRILPEIVQPGTVIGNILPEIGKETGLKNVPVIAAASHDTASAIVSTPLSSECSAYLSSGTWSLLGIELDSPLINDDVLKEDFTNEGGAGNTFRFLKNLTGLWLLQRCKKKWDIDYPTIIEMAERAKPFSGFIDTNASCFLNCADMEQEIINYCKTTGQDLPQDTGSIARCIFESLALAYRHTVEKIEKLTKREIKKLHIIGGGCQNKLLCQFTSNAAKIPVIAGPVEAASIGNILMQAIAKGIFSSVTQGRELVENSFQFTAYEPEDTNLWDDMYEKYLNLI